MTHIQQRRGLASEWLAANPILLEGEAGHETDTGKWKLGDGVTAWASLPYKQNVDSVSGKTGAVVLEVADVDGAAPLDSPALTGNPTAPTPATSDNDTSIATTAHVKANRDELVGSAGTPLDTLGGLAISIGNDPDFIGTMNAALGTKAPLNSPTFTGNPTAPTPALADDDTSIATTAFVKDAVADALSQIGLFTTFDPTTTGFAVSSEAMYYTRIGNTVSVSYRATIASATATVLAVQVPFNFARVPTAQIVGPAHLSDVSANAYATGAAYIASANTVSFFSSAGVWTNTVPFALAAGDFFSFTLTYEAEPL